MEEALRFSADDQEALVGLARRSIEHGVRHREELQLDPSAYPAFPSAPRATFVSLEMEGRLRGCVGTLLAVRPLVLDVVHNAQRAAFHDGRFPPVVERELPRLDVHISILSPIEPIDFSSQAELEGRLRPGIDGVVLEEGDVLGTFLPVMWERFPDPKEFLFHLKTKAGLPASYWSSTIRAYRYTAQLVPEPLPLGV